MDTPQERCSKLLKFFSENFGACSCVFFARQLGCFILAKRLPHETSCRFPSFLPFGRWPLALLRRAEMGNLHEVSCGKRFANIPHPSCRANKTQLRALRKSQKNSSNLLQRFWAVSIDSGRCLRKLPAERGPNRAEIGRIPGTNRAPGILRISEGPWRCAAAN